MIRTLIFSAWNRIGGAFAMRRGRRRNAAYWTPEREAEARRVQDEFASTPPERRGLLDIERAIIRMAVEQLTVGRAEAEAQLALATYGGLTHAGTHVCFMIDVPDSAPRIPDGHGGPITLDVDLEGTIVMSNIEVFIHDGRLHSVDLTEIDEADDDRSGTQWPALSRIHPFQWGSTT
jgi:hypothetical protein